MEDLFWIGFVGAAIALLFAWLQRSRVMSFSEGNEKMRKIAASIREGANAYLKHQYTTVFKVFLVVFILLLIIAFGSGGKMLSQFTPFAFLTGGIWSMLAGFIGMKIATNSNARTAQAASESLNKGLRVAFSPVPSWASPWWAWACWTSRSGFSCCAMLSASMIRCPWAISW